MEGVKVYEKKETIHMEPAGMAANGNGYYGYMPLQFEVGISNPAAFAKSAQRDYKPQGQIHATEIIRTEMYVPGNDPQKPYEYVSGITDRTSPAWKTLHRKGVDYEHDGTIRIAGYTAVALGKKYGSPGDKFDIELSSGRWIRVIIADSKQQRDTKNGQGWQGTNGHVLEMIVWSVPAKVQIHGSYNVLPKYKGEIVSIYREEN